MSDSTPAVPTPSQLAATKGPQGSKKRPKKTKSATGQMSLREHLRELRNRVIISGIAIVLGTIVGVIFYKPVYSALTAPISSLSTEEIPTEIVFSTVGQPLDVMLKIGFFVGLILSSPVWLYQIWAFIVPGLKKKERRYSLGFIAAAVPLFVGGVTLGWFALPQAMQFFNAITPEGTAQRIQANVYVPFVTRVLLVFGAALVLPVILVGLNMAGVLKGKTMLKHWRITVFIIAVLAAMAAPGSDAITMFYLGGPLVVLYGISLAFALLNDRRRAKKAGPEDTELSNEEIQRGAKPVSEL